MRKFFTPFLLTALLCTSCATIAYKPTVTVTVNTPNRETAVINGDTLTADKSKNRGRYTNRMIDDGLYYWHEVTRGDTLNVAFIDNDKTTEFTIYPEVDFDSQFYNVMVTAGIGCIIDYHSNKRFDYPVVSLDEYRSQQRRMNRIKNFDRRGTINLYISYPWNNWYSDYFSLPKHSQLWGFGGLGIGMEYLYADRWSVSVDAKTTGCLPVPLVGDIEVIGGAEWHNKSYIAASTNYIGSFFTVGFGLCATKNDWRYAWYWNDYYKQQYDEANLEYPTSVYGTEPLSESHWSIGPECKLFLYLPTFPYIQVGASYRPSVTLQPIDGQRRFVQAVNIGFRTVIPLNANRKSSR